MMRFNPLKDGAVDAIRSAARRLRTRKTCFNPLKDGAVDAIVWSWVKSQGIFHPCFNSLKDGAVDAILTNTKAKLSFNQNLFFIKVSTLVLPLLSLIPKLQRTNTNISIRCQNVG